MTYRSLVPTTLALVALGGATACEGRGAATAATLTPVDPSQVCVESGQLQPVPSGGFTVRSAGMRAVVARTTGQSAEIAFTYRGPSAGVAPLASGELRRQIGLKLQAQDTCNVVYVMWHVAPRAGIFASVKSNPGQRTHAACGDRGYVNIAPTLNREVAPVQIGERRTLSASIDGDVLRVSVDGAPVWAGSLPRETSLLAGPAGIRSDNGEFDVDLLAVPGSESCSAGVE